MMNAVPLPTAQGGAAAGFAAFLANMGQDAAGGEAGGFDLLLAETSPLPTSLLSLATGSGPGEDAATAEADDAAATDAAPDAAMAEELLAALTPAIAGTAQPATKAPAAATFAEPAPDAPPSPLAAPKPAPASPMTAVLIAEPQQAAKPLDSGAARFSFAMSSRIASSPIELSARPATAPLAMARSARSVSSRFESSTRLASSPVARARLASAI